MTTIISETFPNGASVSLDMDKDANELFVFYYQKGDAVQFNVTTKKYTLNSYDMATALAYYDECVATEYQLMNDES